MALTGTLEDFGFAEIVQAINQGHKTGELIVRRSQEEARVRFCEGEVVQARLSGPALPEQIVGAEVIYRLLGWKKGEFEFHRGGGALPRFLQESTEELILEGMKRLDEWEKVEEEMTDLNVVLRVSAAKAGEKYEELSEEARAILRLVDARRDVASIIRESGLEAAQALLTITELISQEVVEKWEAPSAGSSSSVLRQGKQEEGEAKRARGPFSPGQAARG